ncbi:MAG TPA: hypothetical protein VLL27_06520 [Solirubrobacterales bacterium]|nr:hypothetical protein [Solirubrobacterales bacterium]
MGPFPEGTETGLIAGWDQESAGPLGTGVDGLRQRPEPEAEHEEQAQED